MCQAHLCCYVKFTVFLRFQMALVVVSMCNFLDTSMTQEAQLRLGVFFLGSPVPVTVSFDIIITLTILLNICLQLGLISTRHHCFGRVEQLSNRARPSANSCHNIHLRPFIPHSRYQSPRNTSGCDGPLSQCVKVNIHGIQRFKGLV